jgi:hypothetical protein
MNTTAVPWYREPFVWMLVAIPLLSVIGGVTLLTLAIRSDDGLVVDDYYRRGKLINRELKRDAIAAENRLRADLSLVHGERLALRVDGRPPQGWPATLELKVLHATRAGHDQHVVLVRTAQGYDGRLTPLVPGRWYLELSAPDWRLLGEWQHPRDRSARLSAGGA